MIRKGQLMMEGAGNLSFAGQSNARLAAQGFFSIAALEESRDAMKR